MFTFSPLFTPPRSSALFRSAWSSAVSICLLTTTLGTAACRGDKPPEQEPSKPSVQGPAGALGQAGDQTKLLAGASDVATMAQAFGVARSVLYGDAASDTSKLDDLPGRRTFVCAYGLDTESKCGTGSAENLAGSVRAAAEDLRDAAKVTADVRAKVKLKIDVVTHAHAETFDGDVLRSKSRDVGIDGLWVQTKDDNNSHAYVLPSEVLEQGLFGGKKKNKGLARRGVVKSLKSRNKGVGDLDGDFPFDEIRTVAWVERDHPPAGEPDIVRLYRTHKWDWEPIEPDHLLQFAVWAGDYLISSVAPDGAIRYQYFVDSDRDSRSYNWLRHGGTTYSMLQLYDRTKFEPYRLASEKAIEKMLSMCERDERKGPHGGGATMFLVSPSGKGKYTPDGKRLKLGGAGLALLALTTHAEATGQRDRYVEDARAFARFIVASQQQSGEFVYFPPYKPDDPVDSETSLYYPGEAMLGLMKLYALDKNPLWLDTVRRAADWLIDVRDRGKTPKSLANDHWLMIALSYFYLYTKEQKYLDHSLNLARAVEHQYQRNLDDAKAYRDYFGGYYDPPRSTPAATRGEGLVAVLDSCNVAKADCAWVEKLLHDTIQHEMLSMYQPDLMYWIRNKPKAFGAFNGGIIDTSIRNDFVQHNMSAVLGYERHLRKKSGVSLPGGPEWTDQAMAGTATFNGLSDAEVVQLRQDTLRYRGKDRWTLEAEKLASGAASPKGAAPTDGGTAANPSPSGATAEPKAPMPPKTAQDAPTPRAASPSADPAPAGRP